MNVNGFPLAGSQEFPDNSFLITLNDPSNSLFEADSIRQEDLQLEIDGSLNPHGSLKLNTNDPDAPSFSFLRMLLEPASPLQFPQPQE